MSSLLFCSLIQSLTNSFFFLSSWFSYTLWTGWTFFFAQKHIHTMSWAVSLRDDEQRPLWCDSCIGFSWFIKLECGITRHHSSLQKWILVPTCSGKRPTCSFIHDPGQLADKTVMLKVYQLSLFISSDSRYLHIFARAWQIDMGSGQICVSVFTGLPVFGCDLLKRNEFWERDVDVFT